MATLSIAIVGAGLSGLRTASLLAARGVDSVILEGRSRMGGRVYSAGCESASLHRPMDRFYLGGT
jgi:monoamine oxidase